MGNLLLMIRMTGLKLAQLNLAAQVENGLTMKNRAVIDESDSDSSVSDSSSSFSETSYDRYKDKTAKSLKRKRAHFRKKRKHRGKKKL